MRWWVGVLLATVLIGTPAGAGERADPGSNSLAVPAMSLRDLDGGLHDVGEALGKGPLVVFFWSVYCPNCKDAMPGLVSLYGRRRAQGMTVWAINVDGDRFSNAVRAYVEDLQLPFPVVFDRLEGELLVAADPLGVSKTPTLFVADGRGKILLRQTVDVDYDAVEDSLAHAH
jgi:peroxiredoxin